DLQRRVEPGPQGGHREALRHQAHAAGRGREGDRAGTEERRRVLPGGAAGERAAGGVRGDRLRGAAEGGREAVPTGVLPEGGGRGGRREGDRRATEAGNPPGPRRGAGEVPGARRRQAPTPPRTAR